MKLQVKNVSKYYKNVHALDNISFEAESGEIFGLLGRNGAGKTTLIKLIMKIIEPDNGDIKIDYEMSDKSLGYLPEERGLYLNLSVKHQLLFISRLNGLNKTEALKNINYYLNELGIDNYINKKLNELSKGNKQKVQLISALVHKPKLIILDEPFSGLDPINIEIFKNLVKKCKNNGQIILLSSHRIEDIEEMCDKVLFLKKGLCLIQGTIEEIISDYKNNNTILFKTNKDIEQFLIKSNITFIKQEKYCYKIDFEYYYNVLDIIEQLKINGIQIIKFEVLKTTLHDVFIKELSEDYEENIIRS